MSSVSICIKLFPINYTAIYSSPPLVFLPKKPLLLRPRLRLETNLSKKPISSASSSNQKNSYAVSYLINSCGLSPESAISASEKLKFESPERPDSVINLLRTHGFTETQITILLRKRPLLLLADSEKTLLPKLEFFRSIGVSRSDLARIISLDPSLLTRSLENHIIPNYTFLKSVLQSDKKVATALKHTSWVFLDDHKRYLVPNIAVLRDVGVSDSHIALLLTHFPHALMRKQDQLKQTVNKVKEMGFNPLKSTFVLAVQVLGKGSNTIWDRCYKAYGKWGWSEDDILLAFRKHPHCMVLSEKKISRALEFFVNKMGWHSKEIARCPTVLFFSMEKRIIPRCSVIQVLLVKGLVKKDLSLGTILVPAEKYFMERFVTNYEEEVPQLLSVYQGKMDILEL